MKHVTAILIILLFITFSCDEAKKILNPHQPPVIDEVIILPTSRIVNPADTVYLEVQATNPEEGALTYQWSVSPAERGTFLESTDKATTRWKAPVQGDTYVFTILVSNTFKSTSQDRSVVVVDLKKPIVNISSPKAGEYFVQLSEIQIVASAIHANGIDKVELFVNDQQQAEQAGHPSDEYQFTFTPDTTLVGQTEIKIEATAKQVQKIGRDSIRVFIEGILPGK